MLNALQGQVREQLEATWKEAKAYDNPLMFVDIKLKGKVIRAMVDTGARHNFIADREAKRLGFKLAKSPSCIKKVNSEAKLISRLAKGVDIKIGDWSSITNFMVFPLDYF